ncbi:MAG TPA: NTF2-like N-terminal transpeptidase domain-containing protein, partial [Thermomicrobiales bacterium]|nr:NTF2-like N-terminal transpeptidase domain-containing protein [Thermomicrobiales bacterium]
MLALFLVLGLIAVAAVMRPSFVPLGRLSKILVQDAPPPQVAPTPEPAVAASATAPVDTEPDAVAVAEASPAPVERGLSADEVAGEWITRWNARDYAAMYALTSGTVRRTLPLEEFTGRYQGIDDRAELHAIRAEITGEAGDMPRVPFRVTFESGIAGEFSEENALPLVQEEDGWRVAWTPSTIFSELGNDGCVDVDRLPSARGKILDRLGEPLAYDGLVQRVGIVPGLIPAEDEERVLRELGDLTKMNKDDIKARYEEADPSWFVPIMDFPTEEGERLLDVISRLPGVSVKAETARVYPLGERAAH